MIMEHNCSVIVMLTNLEEKGKEMCYRYWPTEKSVRYYYYVIEPVSETRHTHFYIREFKVTDARVSRLLWNIDECLKHDC